LFYEVHGLGRNIFSPRPFFITLSENETTLLT
jgi:hypothetical protein